MGSAKRLKDLKVKLRNIPKKGKQVGASEAQ